MVVIIMRAREFDVNLSSITEKNSALSFSRVGQPCPRDWPIFGVVEDDGSVQVQLQID